MQHGIDHREFLRSLDLEARRRLMETADAPGLVHLAIHLGLIAALGALILAGVPAWWALLVPQGVLLVFLFTLLHETTHRTTFRTEWINRAVAWLCGLAILIPPAWFRYFHFAHHRFTQDPEQDPELAKPKPETWPQYLWHLTGIPTWKGVLGTLFRNAAGRCRDPYVPEARLGRIAWEARAMLGVYAGLTGASLAAGSWALIWVWVLPMLLGQPFLRAYLLAEHGRCPMVANMFENTRTTFTGWLIRKLAWNMPYHAEHHAVPTVPYHRLPELHRLTRDHLRETEQGYLAFHRKYAAALDG